MKRFDMKKLTLIALVLVLHCECVLALGLDYPPGMRLLSPTDWPSGLASLRDSQRWVHGYGFGFAEDNFFYAGDADSFGRFLTRFAALPTASHTLILHHGTGVAKSPWNLGPGLRCDWKMHIEPRWRQAAFNKPVDETKQIIRHNLGCTVSLDLWLNGGVNFAEVKVPANVTVVSADEEPKQNAATGTSEKQE